MKGGRAALTSRKNKMTGAARASRHCTTATGGRSSDRERGTETLGLLFPREQGLLEESFSPVLVQAHDELKVAPVQNEAA